MEVVEVLLEEYKSVRQESLDAVGQQQAITQYWAASVSVGLGLGLVTAGESVGASAVILMGMLPLLIMCWAVMIVIAAQRVVLARRHLRCLERRVAAELGAFAPLSWESSRAERAARRSHAYVFGIFAAIATTVMLGPGVGGLILAREELWAALAVAEVLDVAAIAAFTVWIWRTYRRLMHLQ